MSIAKHKYPSSSNPEKLNRIPKTKTWSTYCMTSSNKINQKSMFLWNITANYETTRLMQRDFITCHYEEQRIIKGNYSHLCHNCSKVRYLVLAFVLMFNTRRHDSSKLVHKRCRNAQPTSQPFFVLTVWVQVFLHLQVERCCNNKPKNAQR
jgi:hypothetical protein